MSYTTSVVHFKKNFMPFEMQTLTFLQNNLEDQNRRS